MAEADPFIRTLVERVHRTEEKIEEVTEAIVGNPAWQTSGIRQELDNLKERQAEDRKLLNDLERSLELERAERKGQRKLLRTVGISSILGGLTTLITLVTVVYTLMGAL